MSSDTSSRSTASSSISTKNVDANIDSDHLTAMLKTHFNHTEFKSKLQRDAIRTILKRKFHFSSIRI